MICIYCSGATSVTNSRKQKGGQSIWRRRLCKHCGAIFTTIETVDLSSSLMVEKKSKELIPFSRDTLFYSIAASCGHRKDTVIADASALTDTIITALIAAKQPAIPVHILTEQTLAVLQRFDPAAASYYQAYFSR